MPIEHKKHGATVLTGDAIQFCRLCAIRSAVSLECKGIKMRRGTVVWKQAKAEYGLKGKNKHAVLAELEALIDEERGKQEHVTPDGIRLVDGQEVQ